MKKISECLSVFFSASRMQSFQARSRTRHGGFLHGIDALPDAIKKGARHTLVLLSGSHARAELTVYHSRVDFEAAATDPLFSEDFEAYPRDVVLAPGAVPLFGGAVSLSAESGNRFPISIDTPPYLFGPYGAGGIDAPGFGDKFVLADIMDGGGAASSGLRSR